MCGASLSIVKAAHDRQPTNMQIGTNGLPTATTNYYNYYNYRWKKEYDATLSGKK